MCLQTESTIQPREITVLPASSNHLGLTDGYLLRSHCWTTSSAKPQARPEVDSKGHTVLFPASLGSLALAELEMCLLASRVLGVAWTFYHCLSPEQACLSAFRVLVCSMDGSAPCQGFREATQLARLAKLAPCLFLMKARRSCLKGRRRDTSLNAARGDS